MHIHFYHIPRTGGNSIYRFHKEKRLSRFFGLHNNGHTPFRPYNMPSFVFLRNPATHTLSSYHYIREHKSHKLHTEMQSKSLEQVLLEGRTLDKFVGFFSPGYKGENRLEVAKRNLDKVTFVGFQERFNEDMNILIRDVFKIPNLAYSNIRQNPSQVSRKGLTPSPAELRLLRELRADDYELVCYAMKRRGVVIPL